MMTNDEKMAVLFTKLEMALSENDTDSTEILAELKQYSSGVLTTQLQDMSKMIEKIDFDEAIVRFGEIKGSRDASASKGTKSKRTHIRTGRSA